MISGSLLPTPKFVNVYDKSGNLMQGAVKLERNALLNFVKSLRGENLFVFLSTEGGRSGSVNHYYLGNKCRLIVSKEGIFAVSNHLRPAKARFPFKILELPCTVISRGEACRMIARANGS